MSGKTQYTQITPFTTQDGSQIRELMHPQQHDVKNQSLAEARVAPSNSTLLHKHLCSEEIYNITEGEGLMTLGEEQFKVTSGDTICIPPGTAHCITNTGDIELVILCCCSPAYSDSDTQLL